MRVQVIVKQDDRVWDFIRNSRDSALFRVATEMKRDSDGLIQVVGGAVTQHLIAFGSGDDAIKYLIHLGFRVETKKIPNPTI